jgi:hypothetical protein
MAASSYDNTAKPVRKRSSATGTLVGVRMQADELKAIDTWARKQVPPITRPYAIRRLVELGLTVKPRSAPSERQRSAFADLASRAIDRLTREEPDSAGKASRKRHLLKGPEEFREVRVDRPRTKGK